MHFLHFFIPHKKNNHRAKLLHNISLFVILFAVCLTSTSAIYLHKNYPQVLGVSYQISNDELLNLTNYERSQEGLPPLALNKQLSNAADKKSQHMFQYNYWAHFAPDGTTPWDFIRGEGYDYSYAGENLAKGFTTSYDAVKAWMKSPTHRANILSDRYAEVGFAVREGKLQGEDTVLIVQEFGSRTGVDLSAAVPPDIARAVNPIPEVRGSSEVTLPQIDYSSQKVSKAPALDITGFAKSLTFFLLSALLIALILDFIIIEKKKIPRTVGNNLDHIILVTVFISFVFMAKLGHVI